MLCRFCGGLREAARHSVGDLQFHRAAYRADPGALGRKPDVLPEAVVLEMRAPGQNGDCNSGTIVPLIVTDYRVSIRARTEHH